MQRRAECNLGDLVEKLTTSYEENTKGIVAGFEENTKGIVAALGRIHDIVNATADDGGQSQLTLTILQNGEGDKTKTTGLPWNPMSALGEYVTAPATCACAWGTLSTWQHPQAPHLPLLNEQHGETAKRYGWRASHGAVECRLVQ